MVRKPSPTLKKVLDSAARLQGVVPDAVLVGDSAAVNFRNVDASPDDDVTTWPYEALVTVIERGLVPDWQPVFAEIRRNPWGPVARRVAQIAASTDDVAVGQLFSLALARARTQAEALSTVLHRGIWRGYRTPVTRTCSVTGRPSDPEKGS